MTPGEQKLSYEELRHSRTHGLAKIVAAMTGIGLAASLFAFGISLQQMIYTRQSLHAVQRAFVSRTGVTIKHYPGYLALTVNWINNGTTQTINAFNQVSCAVAGTFQPELQSKIKISLAPKQERPGGYCKLADTGSFVANGGSLFVLLRIKYDDVFQAHHIYSECAEYIVPPHATENSSFDSTNCNGNLDKYNCVDEECKGDAANW